MQSREQAQAFGILDTEAGAGSLLAKCISNHLTLRSSHSLPQSLIASLLPMPDGDLETQGAGWSESVSWGLQARDSPTALGFLFTLALARKILESIRACSYEMASRNHVIFGHWLRPWPG